LIDEQWNVFSNSVTGQNRAIYFQRTPSWSAGVAAYDRGLPAMELQ